MKLKNKQTGEIIEVESLDVDTPTKGIAGFQSFDRKGSYNSLAELNEEWEDVPEEPKTHWMIDTSVLEPVREIAGNPYEIDKEIGNWFSTKEEAELAVEKLKAWKRLKDKGFRFDATPALGHRDDEKFDISITAIMPSKWWYDDKVVDDIHSVLGGEE